MLLSLSLTLTLTLTVIAGYHYLGVGGGAGRAEAPPPGLEDRGWLEPRALVRGNGCTKACLVRVRCRVRGMFVVTVILTVK